MRRFDKNGMMIIPNPIKSEIKDSKNVLIIKECYCQNGHNLINSRAKFNDNSGIILKVKKDDNEGLVALSPVYGDDTRISLDIDLISGEIYELCCPECDSALPEFSPCSCGAELKALFNTKNADFSNCTGVCNRVDCANDVIHSEGEMLSISMIDSF